MKMKPKQKYSEIEALQRRREGHVEKVAPVKPRIKVYSERTI